MKLNALLAVLFLACAAELPDVGTAPAARPPTAPWPRATSPIAAPAPSPARAARVTRVDLPNADVVVFDNPAVVWITAR